MTYNMFGGMLNLMSVYISTINLVI